MKNLKKVLAFVVVFAMMFTFAVSANSFPDVSETASYAEAVTILSSLGLMIGDDNGNFNPDKILTRAEAATLIVRARGLESAAAGAKGATAFTDVAAEHWASGFINMATQTGIIVGMGDGTFKPEDQVTYEQFVKMIVAALGYTPVADAQGGYPTGYLVVASREGITKGATGSAGEPAARSTVARLLYNALEVPTMEQTVFSAGNEEYEKSDESLLTGALNFEKYEGVVTSAELSANKDKYDKTTVTILPQKMLSADLKDKDLDNEYDEELDSIDVGDTNAADLVGYYVTVYTGEDEETGKQKIYAIAAKTGRNDMLTIDYSQLNKKTVSNVENLSIWYTEEGSNKAAKEITLADNVKFIYNGAEVDSEDAKDAVIAFFAQASNDNVIRPGSVTFINSDNSDKAYEYVLITEYNRDFVVKEIDVENGVIDAVEGEGLEIDPDDDDIVYSFYKNGNAASIEDVAVDDVLTIAESVDAEPQIIKVFISSEVVEGSVSESGTDGKETVFTIAGEQYKAPVVGGAINKTITEVGDDGVFYINVDGRVVYKDAVSTAGGNYAYLFKAGTKTDAIDDGVAQIQYLKADGTWETKSLSSTVTIYEGSTKLVEFEPKNVTKDVSAVFETQTNYKEDKVTVESVTISGVAEKQLIQFKTKSDGTINRIYIADDSKDSNFKYNGKLDGKEYNAKQSKIYNVKLNDDVIVFNVDTAKEDKQEGYSVSTVKATFNDGDKYTVEVYDQTSSTSYPKVLVAFDAKASIAADTPIFVISRVATASDADGNTVIKLYGYQDGASVSAEVPDDADGYDEAEKLEAGDVIIFSLGASGKIDDIAVLIEKDDVKKYIDNGTAVVLAAETDADVDKDFGKVLTKSNGDITLENDNLYGLDTSVVKIYTVNFDRDDAVSTGRLSDITTDISKRKSYVYVRLYDGVVTGAVVYQITPEKVVEEEL